MKKIFLSVLLAAGIAAVATPASAQTIRRCNNVGVTGTNIYTTAQAAHDAATAGDIIYLEPSSASYGNLNCTKALTFIGTGYYLTEQSPALQVDNRSVLLDGVYINAGSGGARITGCTITNTFVVSSNNVIIERNLIQNTFYYGYNPNSGNQEAITTGLIRQNFMTSNLYLYTNSFGMTGVLISNNVIRDGIGANNTALLNGLLISNNVLGYYDGTGSGELSVNNSVVKNNIITVPGGSFTTGANTYTNNIGAGTQFGTANGNKQNVNMANVFMGAAITSTDGAYKLKAGATPATGAGESGVDCGAYGGAVPYIQAGIPAVPTIYQYSQSVSGTTLNATISTRSNK